MGRSDGKLVRGIPAFDRLIPRIMNRRYDATNFVKVEFDMAKLHELLRRLRMEGHQVGVMDAVISAFALLLQRTPELNRFIANKKIYQRNHVCVSFAIIKRGTDGEVTETAVKVYIEPEDNLLTISQKMREIIKENEKPQTENALDRFVNGLMAAPLLPSVSVWLIKFLDRWGMLPKRIIKLSPFHTSMFISNLASIQMNYVYHHLYEFGTTSTFITLGMPKRLSQQDGKPKRVLTLGISIDERICTGAIWARSVYEFKRIMEHPERLLGEHTGSESTDVSDLAQESEETIST